MLTPDGEVEVLVKGSVPGGKLQALRPMVCHSPATAQRLGVQPFVAHDLLELFAFARPATFCAPTPRGLARALGIPVPGTQEQEARTLALSAMALLDGLWRLPDKERAEARNIAWAMTRAGWPWGPAVLSALGVNGGMADAPPAGREVRGLQVWKTLPEISEHAPEPAAGHLPVEPEEARRRLADLLGSSAEDRPQQADYASAVSGAFVPRPAQDAPTLVLAEAGTGVGKTLGYIAPASLWAERNEGCVWISTYTRNLQRQLDRELDRLYPDPDEKARRVVVRKGRENYLCLLNMDEASGRLASGDVRDAVALGLMARWVRATRDGDLVGGDFPGWLTDLLGRERTLGLADRRGECIFSACEHYNRCFIERAVRRARRARLVVANHALVMVQAALGGLDDGTLPTRYVFDEGHHLFDAADGAFSAHFTGLEAAEMRRWLLGPEGDGLRSRGRGLKRRSDGLFDPDGETAGHLDAALIAARALPGAGVGMRLGEGQPKGPVERFLAAVRAQVLARARGTDGPHSLETEVHPPDPALLEAAGGVAEALGNLVDPLKQMVKDLMTRLDDDAAELDTQTRTRIESLARAIERRVVMPAQAWKDMVAGLGNAPSEALVDWLGVDRQDGREVDVGLHRHWVDPTEPFANAVARRAHGLVVTSATLRDGSGEVEADWRSAEQRSGADHLPLPAVRAAVASPFDYPAATRVLVVTDVRKDDLAQVSSAMRELFLAAGGGALGLFTAISRLRAVHGRIAGVLETQGLPLLAQHVDAMDVSTLIEVFRAEEDACLLGTDAVRDGVDVPGRSLRLIVFDRVPWPRPDILHKARRSALGGRGYDDMLTRLKLKQAFGRLVRRASDRGVFVLLDPMMPSRLSGAFPPGVEVERVGLAEAVAIIRQHIPHPGGAGGG